MKLRSPILFSIIANLGENFTIFFSCKTNWLKIKQRKILEQNVIFHWFCWDDCASKHVQLCIVNGKSVKKYRFLFIATFSNLEHFANDKSQVISATLYIYSIENSYITKTCFVCLLLMFQYKVAMACECPYLCFGCSCTHKDPNGE